jgi:hypothetical protein
MVGDDACDVRLTGIGAQKGLTYAMHSAQGEIADRPHTEMPFARAPKGPLADADGRANFGKTKWPVGMFLQERLEFLHNLLTTAGTRRLTYG